MPSFLRSALLAFAAVAPCTHAAAPDPALLGCWRAAKIVLYTQDGAQAEDSSGRCSLQFKEDQLESTCRTTSGSATTTYRYEVVRPQVYAATMAGSTFRTEMVGSTREYEYRIEGDQLRTVTVPPALAFAAAAVPQRVETDAARVPCP
ncbi:MAG: hypothetical protein IV104_00445 [Acidovorax sp.]|nr:hypothetical protein [Acidovorax sp.]